MGRKSKAGKATLLGIGTALIPWAIQQLLVEAYGPAAVAFAIGFAALYVREHYEEMRVPVSVHDLQDFSDALGTELERRTRNLRKQQRR